MPRASTRPPRACPDSTLPIAASNCRGSRQPGSVRPSELSDLRYAERTVAGMPASAQAGTTTGFGFVPDLGGSGVFSGGNSVW